MFEKKLQVRFGECDGLGHVNNGTYFTYMEDARMDVFRLFNPVLALERWNLIVAGTRCDFLAQVKYADVLTVSTWISKTGNSSFVVEHLLTSENGTPVARGQATLIAYDYENKKAVPISPQVRDALAEHAVGPADAPALRS